MQQFTQIRGNYEVNQTKLNALFQNFRNSTEKLIFSPIDNEKSLFFNLLSKRISAIKDSCNKLLKEFEERNKNLLNFHSDVKLPDFIAKNKRKNTVILIIRMMTFQNEIILKTENCIQENISLLFGESEKKGISIVLDEPTKASTISTNKITLNLSKKEIALLFILLYEVDIIKIKTSKELYDFIESHFNYIDKNNDKEVAIIKINTEFSRLKTAYGDNQKSNQKLLKKFMDNYEPKIDEVMAKMKNTKLSNFGQNDI